MERIDKILKHPVFNENLNKINEIERDRKYCRHDLGHFLDVARIGSIILAQNKVDNGVSIQNITDEYMYAAALLHDLGRAWQYEKGIPHEIASAEIAKEILTDCGFSVDEIEKIVSAILYHKGCADKNPTKDYSIESVLYKADKISRCCFLCKAREDCKWSNSDKNNTVIY